jgi:uncharacterized cupin superfamily protein
MMDARQFILRSSEIKEREQVFSHPWNPNSQLIGVQLSRALALKRAAVSIARMPAGKESFVYHSHRHEEEWLYILSGRAMAEINGAEVEVGPGDFIAFPPPSVAHQLRNPFNEELVYLMGGENREFDVADFPRLGKRVVKSGEMLEVYDLSNARPFGPLEK